MEAQKRNIESGLEYERYFQQANGVNELIKRNSKLEDTVQFLPEAVQRTSKQTASIARHLKGFDVYDTCKKIWKWIYRHIDYNKDDKGKEQIRSPRRSFRDRFRGVDCDDYTVLISTILTNLNIKHILRVAKYTERNGFQHIYPVVPLSNGSYITVDCVVDRFNYEVPFIEKIDTNMDLEFLDGIDGTEATNIPTNGIDAEDLVSGLDTFGDIGKLQFRPNKVIQSVKQGITKAGSAIKTAASNATSAVKTGLHVVNKANPATLLLRTGILAALKLNMFNVAGQLRYAYLDSNTAARKNFDMGKFNRLVEVKNKLEKIFYGAGGTQDNFKKAILTGKGNENKEVPLSGLGAIDYNTYNEQDSLSRILGIDSYTAEISGVQGLGSLGEPATATALAAATSVLAAIAGLLKSIGSLRKDGKQGDASTSSATDATTNATTSNEPNTNDEASNASTSSASNDATNNESVYSDATTNANSGGGENKSTTETPAVSDKTEPSRMEENTNTDLMVSNARSANTNAKEATPSAFDKVKDWVSKNKLATAAIGATVIGLTVWGISAYRKSKNKNKGSVAGVPRNSKNKRNKKSKNSKKKTNITYQKLR